MPYRQDLDTGELIEVDAQGNPVSQRPPAASGSIVRVPNPRADQSMAIEAARLNLARQAAERAEQSASATQANSAASLALQQTRFLADLEKDGRTIDAQGRIVPIPGWTPRMNGEQIEERRGKLSRIDQLAAQIDRVEQLFDEGAGATRGIASLADFNPFSDENAQLDTAGASLSQQGLGAFRIPGTGPISDRDSIMFDKANLPQASSVDAKTREQIYGLKSRVNEELQSMGMAPRWGDDGKPLPAGQPYPEQQNPFDSPSAQGMKRADGSIADALSGGQRFRRETLEDTELTRFAYDMFKRGKSLNEISDAVQTKFPGAQPFIVTPETYRYAKDKLKKGEEWNPFVETRSVPLTFREKVSGSDTGAFLANMGNAGSLGLVGAIDPNAMAAMRSGSPKASFAGEIAGTLMGLKGINGVTSGIAQKHAPTLYRKFMNNSSGMSRALAADTAYGTARGAIEYRDPATGFLAGMGGSAGGQALFGGGARIVSGVRSSPSVQYLRDQGLTPTLGQIMRGRAADNGGQSYVAGMEDVVSNTPFAGTLVNARRGEAAAAANTEGFRTVGGSQITGTGDDALDQLGNVRTQAYNDFAQSTSLPTREPRFLDQVAGINPGLARTQFDDFMGSTINPILNETGEIGGRRLQELLQTIQQNKGLARRSTGDAVQSNAFMKALEQLENAITANAARNAPGSIPKLKAANKINRGFSVLDDASSKAMNEPGQVWTAAQLGQALRTDASRFSGGSGLSRVKKSDLSKLQMAMAAVLPNRTPPTGVNTAPILAAGGLATGVLGERTDNDWLRAVGALGLLATPYTKMGSNLTARALLDRPAKVAELGMKLRKKKGLFGGLGSGATRDYDNKTKD